MKKLKAILKEIPFAAAIGYISASTVVVTVKIIEKIFGV